MQTDRQTGLVVDGCKVTYTERHIAAQGIWRKAKLLLLRLGLFQKYYYPPASEASRGVY